MMLLLIVLFAVCSSDFVQSKQTYLTSVEPCSRDVDDYVGCSTRTLSEAWPMIIDGIPEYKIPRLDPLTIEHIAGTIDCDIGKGSYAIRNLTAYGLANVKFLKMDPKHSDNFLHLTLEMYQKKFLVEGDYDINVGSPHFVISGSGHFNASINDISVTVVMTGPVVNDRWILESVNVSPEIGDMKIWASDLFNGNQQLTEAALLFANTYWKTFYPHVLPYAIEQMNAKAKDYFGDMLLNIPFSKLFP